MNSAHRLLDLLDRLASHPSNNHTTAAQAWAAALEVELGAASEIEDQLSLPLQYVRGEIAALIAELADRGIPDSLYASQCARLRTVASVAQLSGQWKGLVGNINPPDTRLPFAWAALLLPDDEAEVDEAEVRALRGLVVQLEQDLGTANLPPMTAAFVRRQLGTIRAALGLWRVRGISAIREAVEQAGGAAVMERERIAGEASIAPQEAKSFLQRVNDFLGRTVAVCDSVGKVQQGVQGVISMAQVLRIAWTS